MLDAAERFLTWRDETADAIWQYQLAPQELLDAKTESIAQAEIAQEQVVEFDAAWAAAGSQDEDIPPEFQRAIRAMNRTEAAGGLANPLRLEAREEAQQDAEEAKAALRGLHEYGGQSVLETLAPAIREQLRGQIRFAAALIAMGDTAAAARQALSNLHASVARVAVVFPAESNAPKHGERVKEELLEAFTAVNTAMKQEESPLDNPAIAPRLQTANSEAIAFATAVSGRTRRHWRI
jgi:hypothetical protein